jgi:hypothetical protein
MEQCSTPNGARRKIRQKFKCVNGNKKEVMKDLKVLVIRFHSRANQVEQLSICEASRAQKDLPNRHRKFLSATTEEERNQVSDATDTSHDLNRAKNV